MAEKETAIPISSTKLHRSGVLAVALDGQGKWFRFHHLFQDLLQRQMANLFGKDDIAELHARAAEWLETNGFL